MSNACSLLNRKKENTDYVASLSHSNERGEGGKFIRQKNRFTTPFGDNEGGAANIMMMYRIDIINIDVPAIVVSFFNGLSPRDAT